MRIEHFNTLKEAEERANLLLFQERKNPLTMLTKTHTLTMPNGSFILNQIDEESRAQALIKYINSPEIGSSAELLFIAPSDELTYPFRNLSRESLSFALLMRPYASPFVKPSAPLTPEEAQTYKGETTIREYFGEGEEWERAKKTLLNAMEDGGQIPEQEEADKEIDEAVKNPLLLQCISPSMLTDIAGREVRGVEDYISAIAALSGRSLSPSEERAAVWNYHFAQRDLFFFFASYSFLLTEKYSALKEALSLYGKFGLTEEWEEEYAELSAYDEGAERRIISRYYDKETYKHLTPVSLRELSEYTGIPKAVLYSYAGGSPLKRNLRRTLKK